jgi:hypothetical protein
MCCSACRQIQYNVTQKLAVLCLQCAGCIGGCVVALALDIWLMVPVSNCVFRVKFRGLVLSVVWAFELWCSRPVDFIFLLLCVLIILVLLPLNCGSSRSVYFKHQNSGGSLLISIPFSTTSLNLNFICLLRTMPCDSLNYSCSEIPASIAMSFLCPLCIERFSTTFFFNLGYQLLAFVCIILLL